MADEIISLSEAKARGLKRYFTGKPCIKRHICERRTDNARCLECCREKDRKRYWGNLEKETARNKRYKERNREKIRVYAANRRANFPDLCRAINRKSMRNRSEKFSEQEKAYITRWFQERPGKREEYNSNRRALLANACGTFTASELADIMKSQRNKCAYCRRKFGKGVKATLDHIVSLIKGGRNDRANLQFVCSKCNSSKNSRDPIEYAQSMGMLL